MRPRKAPIANALFNRSRQLEVTEMTVREYNALLEAAKAKNKYPQFLKWQEGRKIILKGLPE